MRSKNNRSVLNDPALAYAAQPAADEVDGMPGWTLAALREEVQRGIDSGPSGEFDFEAFLKERHAAYAARK